MNTNTTHTAKNFAIQLGALASLYVSIISLTVLLFGVITLQFPDAANMPWEKDGAMSSVRGALATLIVFFPSYILLTRLINKARRRDETAYTTLTKWLLYISLVIGGGVLLGDLVALINSFLNGELTLRFVLKVLTLFVIVGGAFVYYLLDTKNYWITHERQSIYAGGVTTVVVVCALITGFLHIDSPTEVREARIDQTQIRDLETIQWRIESHVQEHGSLPETYEELFISSTVPTAPPERAPYSYQVLSADTFELCATFETESSRTDRYPEPRIMPGELTIADPYNWDHNDGRACFERTVRTLAE